MTKKETTTKITATKQAKEGDAQPIGFDLIGQADQYRALADITGSVVLAQIAEALTDAARRLNVS